MISNKEHGQGTEALQEKLSGLLAYVTGGRFSKTTYTLEEMKRFADPRNETLCAECDKERKE